ncbi:phosphotransferase family protein [Pseudonocardia sp. KRD-184]|uniref:Phosphotransferase family protein n=1 Tax=Pseudonocardia oceani TaxID=2792013 RepID=A0ABS6U5Z9_9PSEU|nr:phosphotransferase family protein [Pseudonocardia oceani]MBW0096322.1 phosphotransferase family protein [Pseudonocardia oceani]MBW0109826.1 phosphotransferase family protein [Pseudonocardia oceani]MBW0123255.1 phosphotransferase family protein [Pseudonocardia oceani]MBW0127334.1 phosphotransferase family protein [Pseudonocardia oceani]
MSAAWPPLWSVSRRPGAGRCRLHQRRVPGRRPGPGVAATVAGVTTTAQPDWLSPEVVDLAAVVRWAAEHGLPEGPVEDVRRIGGGTQNIVLRMTWAGRDLVLRRPPEHPRASSNAVLRREMRVLAALAGSDVPHPGFVLGCDDESVLGGVVFYLMEAVDGINPGDLIRGVCADDPAARRAAALDTADALARLAALDHEAVGLGDLGRPEGFLARQVPRWVEHLASYDRIDGYPGSTLPHVDALARWLTDHRPPDARPGIVHGDYHLNNVLLAVDAPRVAAVVDWEMCTIGDPLLDLGWLLVTWPDGLADPIAGGALAALGGLPAPADLAAHYGARSGRDLSALDWYTVLAGFKLAIVIEGTHARAQAGQAERAVGERLHRNAVDLLDRAAGVAGV